MSRISASKEIPLNETSKLNNYRLEHGYDKYFKGRGIDIGCGSDMLSPLVFPSITSIVPYDIEDGDANYCSNLADESFEFVSASHVLEHMVDPCMALSNWIRITKNGGYLVIAVPHEFYYEKNVWPSLYNSDHKWSFRLEEKTVMPKSRNVYDLLKLYRNIEAISVELLLRMDLTYPMVDQTLGAGICQIECVLKKKV